MDYGCIFVATKIATMKTKPYGVRFNEEDLELLKLECGILSPQRAVNFLVQYWRETRFVSGSKVEKLATPVSGVISSQSSMGDVLVKKIEPSAMIDIVAGETNTSDMVSMLEKMKDSGLSKSQLEIRKKKFGF